MRSIDSVILVKCVDVESDSCAQDPLAGLCSHASLPYRKSFQFDQKNDIFWYQLIFMYRFEFITNLIYICIYIYIYSFVKIYIIFNQKKLYNLLKISKLLTFIIIC